MELVILICRDDKIHGDLTMVIRACNPRSNQEVEKIAEVGADSNWNEVVTRTLEKRTENLSPDGYIFQCRISLRKTIEYDGLRILGTCQL